MHRFLRASAVLACSCAFGAAHAETIKSPLVGLWKVTGYTVKDAANHVMAPMGDHPGGYILYTKGGHILLLYTGGDRPAAAGPSTSDADNTKFMATMVAVDGTYRLAGKDKFMVKIEHSWNQSLIGQDLPRDFKVVGTKLTVSFTATGPNGQNVVVTVNSERAE
jgi:hypothetical protein